MKHPNNIVMDFSSYMTDANFSSYMTILSKSAAMFLLEQLKAIKDLGKDRMVKDFVSFIPPSKKPSRKYKYIWDLTILLNHIRLSPPIRDQTMNELIPRVVALLMIFTLARPIEIFRMIPSSLTYSDNRTQVSILTHRKTDAGAATSALSLLRLPENSICPVRYLEELFARARAYSSRGSGLSAAPIITLWRWDNGRAINGVSSLCTVTRRLMTAAGIPKDYTAYTIRHATITKSYRIVGDPLEVNVFSGHSERSNTSAKHYLLQADNWLGFKLATAPAYADPLVPRLTADQKFEEIASRSEGDNSSSDATDSESSDSPAPACRQPPQVRASSKPRHNRRPQRKGRRSNRRHRAAASSTPAPPSGRR
jgi:hypothetical protein